MTLYRYSVVVHVVLLRAISRADSWTLLITLFGLLSIMFASVVMSTGWVVSLLLAWLFCFVISARCDLIRSGISRLLIDGSLLAYCGIGLAGQPAVEAAANKFDCRIPGIISHLLLLPNTYRTVLHVLFGWRRSTTLDQL